jgi:hypothetical protein
MNVNQVVFGDRVDGWLYNQYGSGHVWMTHNGGGPEQRHRDPDQHRGAGERAREEIACHPGHAIVIGDHDGYQQQVSPDGRYRSPAGPVRPSRAVIPWPQAPCWPHGR